MKSRIVLASVLVLAAYCRREPLPREGNAIPVRVEIAKRSAFVPELPLVGVVRASETIPLVAPRQGTLVFPPRFAGGLRTGEAVRRGELVAEVRNDQTRFALTQAKLQMEAANADFERARRSYEQGVVSPAEYSGYEIRARLAREGFKAAGADVEKLRVVAPRDGRLVIAKPLAAGVTVEAGTTIAEVSSGGPSVVEASAAAADRDMLQRGLIAHLAHGTWSGDGTVSEVASVIDASGTARVVIAVAPGIATPPPGTGVDVRVALKRRADVITLPEESIVAGSSGATVFALSSAEGFSRAYRVKQVPVETGGRANGRVEILRGVNDGDRVVVSGADALSGDSMVIEAAEPKP